MKDVVCKIINKSGNKLPSYQTKGSSAVDLYAHLTNPLILEPGHIKLISTGIYISIPMGFEAQVRPRSGLALKKGITVLNSPGTIDCDYRGEVGVILVNYSSKNFKICNGDRIAQLVLSRYEKISWDQVDTLDDTIRGDGGFGSTG